MQSKLQDGSIMICGVLGKDAEFKKVGDKNSSLCKFGVKVGERPSTNDQQKSEAIWVSCQCWNAVAIAAKSFKKGDVVFCVGKIVTDNYNGKVYKKLECEYVDKMIIADSSPAPNMNEKTSDLSDYEDILGDGDVPF